ncbi:MAG: signal peptidase I [Lachnospiraceae bacterium]|nr:signal peptidase I [Lachnospiraceae bacterium]
MKRKKKKDRIMKNRILYEILDWSKAILAGIVVGVFVSSTLIANAQVPSGSMEETIMTGSRIIINRLAYMSREPDRGDIIAFYFPDDGETEYIKRIIALPGETVEGIDGKIYIDGAVYEEDYIKEEMEGSFGPYTVPEDSYFVMGDNRNNSVDSRFWMDKFVEKSEIIGRAEFEYFPQIKWLSE